MSEGSRLKELLESWEYEKRTNQYGMAHLADRAIKLILNEMKLIKKRKKS